MSLHGSHLWCLAHVVACSFLSRHIFLLSSLILLRDNLTLSRHNPIDVVCFMSRHGCLLSRYKFLPSAFQLCCNNLFYVVTLFLLLSSLFVVTYFVFVVIEILPIAWICYHDILFLCCERCLP